MPPTCRHTSASVQQLLATAAQVARPLCTSNHPRQVEGPRAQYPCLQVKVTPYPQSALPILPPLSEPYICRPQRLPISVTHVRSSNRHLPVPPPGEALVYKSTRTSLT